MMHKKNTGNLTIQALATLIILGLFLGNSAEAQVNCEPMDKKRIKIEGNIHKIQTDISNFDSVEQSTNETIKLCEKIDI